MADEEKQEDEVKTEETVNEDTQAELDEIQADFDKLASEGDDPTGDDGDEQTEEENTAEEEKTVEEVEKTEAKETAKDDDLEAEMKAIEEGSTKQAEKEPAKEAEVTPDETDTEDKDKPEKYVSDLDPEEWDEEVIQRDTEKGQKHLDELNAVKKRESELQQKLDNIETQRYTDWLDSKFNSVDEDMEEVFGEGDYDDIEPGSEQYDNRAKVVNRINLIAQAHVNMKKPVPSKNKLFKAAVEREFKDKINKPKREAETKAKLKARSKQVIGKGSRKSSALSAEDTLSRIQAEFDAKLQDD